MSSCVNVKLRKDGTPIEEAIDLLYLYTTPARELADNVDLVYCGNRDKDENDGYCVELTKDKLEEIILYYKQSIIDLDTYRKDLQNRLLKLEERISKVTALDIYTEIEEEIFSVEESIKYAKEEVESQEHFLNLWKYAVKNVWEENDKPWEDNAKYKLFYYYD